MSQPIPTRLVRDRFDTLPSLTHGLALVALFVGITMLGMSTDPQIADLGGTDLMAAAAILLLLPGLGLLLSGAARVLCWLGDHRAEQVLLTLSFVVTAAAYLVVVARWAV